MSVFAMITSGLFALLGLVLLLVARGTRMSCEDADEYWQGLLYHWRRSTSFWRKLALKLQKQAERD